MVSAHIWIHLKAWSVFFTKNDIFCFMIHKVVKLKLEIYSRLFCMHHPWKAMHMWLREYQFIIIILQVMDDEVHSAAPWRGMNACLVRLEAC